MIRQASVQLLNLAIGGTAVGTGLNASASFGDKVAEQLHNKQVIRSAHQPINFML
jgi:fumarate hydratase, class II